MQPDVHDELRGTDRLWSRQLRVCKRDMQCGSLEIITVYNGYKTAVIILWRETFISDERDDSTCHYLHILRFR
jgi:hypothetical protein